MVVSVEITLSFIKVENNLAKWTQIRDLHYTCMAKNKNCTGLYILTVLINSQLWHEPMKQHKTQKILYKVLKFQRQGFFKHSLSNLEKVLKYLDLFNRFECLTPHSVSAGKNCLQVQMVWKGKSFKPPPPPPKRSNSESDWKSPIKAFVILIVLRFCKF